MPYYEIPDQPLWVAWERVPCGIDISVWGRGLVLSRRIASYVSYCKTLHEKYGPCVRFLGLPSSILKRKEQMLWTPPVRVSVYTRYSSHVIPKYNRITLVIGKWLQYSKTLRLWNLQACRSCASEDSPPFNPKSPCHVLLKFWHGDSCVFNYNMDFSRYPISSQPEPTPPLEKRILAQIHSIAPARGFFLQCI